ncbi:preprotein translocase subunit SecG [Solemya velum gill symbiont]|uniref:Protein-export membrane protein SecG n=1 Tax=Solemya velum gill symbiont TaxID=2340 RepID=A0A0B0HA28_SOVGS|nr:preprotein translocase subunit SecG [Solemya velum gill symbiont]KHF25915.1 protein translocase SecABDEFGY-YidC-YajC-Ffh-FtsY, subunit G [Solemya velum gill symbiont]OOY34435.1 preprotein translocase subunit SecG [Solemya velum gill symbiont]OOY37149.1 preprotein translocase subunit SecG [Solemya velum gill symbiont]OOY41161.1 preprotein translocase subunit SecG [Solemya velum gill symbiont]OOY42866.1 preprotein translocase subunit SecG [Solemya velum gill symbiont]
MGLESILIVVFLFVSLGVVGLVLIQHGKGADMGAAFGSGASATVFGSQGSANFLSRATAILAAFWFVLAMTLAWFAIQATDTTNLMDDSVMTEESGGEAAIPAAPAAPVSPVPAPVVESPVSAADTIPAAEIEVPAAAVETEMPAVPEEKPGQ